MIKIGSPLAHSGKTSLCSISLGGDQVSCAIKTVAPANSLGPAEDCSPERHLSSQPHRLQRHQALTALARLLGREAARQISRSGGADD